MARILLVEDRASLRKMMHRALADEGYEVDTASDGDMGAQKATSGRYDLVLTDLKLPGKTGLEVLKASRSAHPQVPVVVLTAFGTVKAAVEALKGGASDFLEKPVEIEDLFDLVGGLVGRDPNSIEFKVDGAPTIIGKHPKMRAALRLLEKVAVTDSTVLLTGESGTGKELFARALHALSPRRKGPFVGVNCAAIPESLMENELFGHEKGAFTGAHRRQAGRFESAHRGTLLLDEVGELSPSVQSKVLRVLEERTFERVGGSGTLKSDVRLVAATNRDLGEMVAQGTFRSDLFFRLEVFPIHLPPLRDRPSDVPVLARRLLQRHAESHGRPALEIDAAAEGVLVGERWPGNVRQLANLLERATILVDGPFLPADTLRELLHPGSFEGEAVEEVEELERVRGALREADGDKGRAAEILGVSYRTLQRRIKSFDLEGFPHYRK